MYSGFKTTLHPPPPSTFLLNIQIYRVKYPGAKIYRKLMGGGLKANPAQKKI